MAIAFKKLVEKTRQRLNEDPEFRPTPNIRNESMLQEAEDFARTMITFKHSVKKYTDQLNKYFKAHTNILQCNLPRVWESDAGHPGHCEPIRHQLSVEHSTWVGGDFDGYLMQDSNVILQNRLDGIIRPIDRWLDGLKVVKARMQKLNSLKLLVDARRRTISRKYQGTLRTLEHQQEEAQAEAAEGASTVTGSVAPPASAAGAPGGAPLGYPRATVQRRVKLQDVNEDTEWRAKHEKRKMNAVSASFEEQERLVFEQLRGLVCDTAMFKSYVASTVLIIKDAFQAAALGMGPCKVPLPGFGDLPGSSEMTLPESSVGTIRYLITGVPESLEQPVRAFIGIGSGSAEAGLPPRASQPLQGASSSRQQTPSTGSGQISKPVSVWLQKQQQQQKAWEPQAAAVQAAGSPAGTSTTTPEKATMPAAYHTPATPQYEAGTTAGAT